MSNNSSFFIHPILLMVGIITLSLISVSIYSNIKLYHQKNEMYILKRSPVVLFGLNCTIILAMILYPFVAAGFLYFSPLALLFVMILFFFTWFAFLSFLIIKNWMIYYKYHWTHYTIDYEWQQIINPNKTITNKQQNWFIKNKLKYGNSTYVAKRIFIAAFICFLIQLCTLILTISATYVNWNVTVIFIGLLLLLIIMCIPIIIYTIIVCKTPAFDDIFSIHWESKMHSRCLITIAIISMLSNVLPFISSNPQSVVYGVPFLIITLYIMNHISTFSIMKKNTHSNTYDRLNASKSSVISLEMILADSIGFSEFMLHLSKEFSMEILLSCVEITCLQKYLIALLKQNGFDVTSIKELENRLLVLPENIPKSYIIEKEETVVVTDNKSFYDAKIKCYNLYCKYISENSEYEVNIDFRLRLKFKKIFYDLDFLLSKEIALEELFLLFEEVKKEMRPLLLFSLARFKQQASFGKIMSLYAVSETNDIEIVYENNSNA
eukprot:420636_1